MVDPVGKSPHPQVPEDKAHKMKTPAEKKKAQQNTQADVKADEQAAAIKSAWQQWLGPTATAEDVQKFMNSLINSIISEIQKDQTKAIETLRKMKEDEGGD